MVTKNTLLSVVIIGIILILTTFIYAQSKYPKTIYVLQNRYIDEVHANQKYLVYAKQALAEHYPNIAYLFVALAGSELVHANNCKNLLSDLGVEVKEIPKPEFKVLSTKENLHSAATVEIEEVNHEYPRLIEYMKPENHEATIQFITYAWKAEGQHHDLMKKVLEGTGIFFGMFAKKIEIADVQFFVCQRCGSTLRELPKDRCPICNSPSSKYMKMGRTR